MDIFEAITNNDLDAVTTAIAAGADLNDVRQIDQYGANYLTPMGYAAAQGATDMVRALLNAGVSPNQSSKLPNRISAAATALQLAVKYDRLETAQLLLEHGGNPNYGGPSHWFNTWDKPIFLAQSGQMTQLLFDHGIQLDSSAHSAFILSVYHNNLDKARVLINNKINVNRPDECGWRPLITAIRSEHTTADMVQLLLAAGAHPNEGTQDQWGNATPLHHCLYELSKTVSVEKAKVLQGKIQTLLSYKANPNLYTPTEQPALFTLTRMKTSTPEMAQIQKEILTHLIQAGANVRLVCSGKSVLDVYRGTPCERPIRQKIEQFNNSVRGRIINFFTGQHQR